MRYYARRRNYNAPSVYLLGGGELQGMDTGSTVLPPERAALAENLWREADGCVCKRPGFRLQEDLQVDGKIRCVREFGGYRFIYYEKERGVAYLRREQGSIRLERRVKSPLTMLPFGDRLLILTPGEWIVVDSEGNIKALRKNGVASLNWDWDAQLNFNWNLRQSDLRVPLIRSGSSPTGKGLNLQPPNDLVPLVQESFVYTKSHQEAKRNRFCLQKRPELMGALPVDEQGTAHGITEEEKAIRVETLGLSARLEVRLLRTDAYGNTTDYWAERPWEYADNISATDAAFWIHGIHGAALAYDGDDNVRITYYVSLAEQRKKAEKILNAFCYTLYGVGGRKDRLFAATDNQIFYSAMDDPLYFSELQRVTLGEGEIGIRLLAGEDTVLTVLADTGAWRITGSAETEAGEYALDAYFSLSLRLPSPKPAGRQCVVAGGELLFYSYEGLCAVTPSGVLDERCVQIRSRRLEGLLKKESPDDIRMYAWQNYLFLAGKKGIYLLDLQRKVKVSGDAYSTHGYEGYFWPGIVADSFASGDRPAIYSEGCAYMLASGKISSDYHDEWLLEGKLQELPIAARWQSGRMIGNPGRCQWFRGLILHCDGATALRIKAEGERGEVTLHDYSGALGEFRYGWLYYGQLYYGCQPKRVRRYPISLSHSRWLRLTLENDVPDQPFRLQTYIIEYQ